MSIYKTRRSLGIVLSVFALALASSGWAENEPASGDGGGGDSIGSNGDGSCANCTGMGVRGNHIDRDDVGVTRGAKHAVTKPKRQKSEREGGATTTRGLRKAPSKECDDNTGCR